jgi:hypothetical protein
LPRGAGVGLLLSHASVIGKVGHLLDRIHESNRECAWSARVAAARRRGR